MHSKAMRSSSGSGGAWFLMFLAAVLLSLQLSLMIAALRFSAHGTIFLPVQ